MDLLDQTREWLQSADLQEVADALGFHVRYLYRLRNDEIPNPGVCKVQKVFNYLAAKQGDGRAA